MQSLRLNTTASNLANADSVVSSDGQPYRAKQVVFAATPMAGPAAQGVRVTQVVERRADAPGLRPEEPGRQRRGLRDDAQRQMVEEMTNMISASRAYQTNADVMGTAKTLMERPWPSASNRTPEARS